MQRITENTIEEFAIELLKKSGYQYIFAPSIAPDLPERVRLQSGDAQAGSNTSERECFEKVLWVERLQTLVGRVNPEFPKDVREEVRDTLLSRLMSGEVRVPFDDN